MATLDLKQKEELVVYADKDVLYNISFNDVPNLDTGYTIVLNEGEITELTYTVGSGIVLVSETNSIVWQLDTNDLIEGKHYGYLVSDSDVAGLYLNIDLIVII